MDKFDGCLELFNFQEIHFAANCSVLTSASYV
jgi:hypothetical protein